MGNEMRPRNPEYGSRLLLEHCAALDQMSHRHREPARVRLQRALGPDLSHLLLRALAREDTTSESRFAAGDPAA